MEQGTHEALLENPDGFYAALIKRQMDSTRKLEGMDVPKGDGAQQASAKKE